MKKGITIIVAAIAAVAVILGAFSVSNNLKNRKEFIADGYILSPSKEEMVTNGVDKQYYFSQGSKYKEEYGTQIIFNDQNGEAANITPEHFLHYADGSLGAFTKGVLFDVTDLDQSNHAYYSLTKKTILIKNGASYELSTKGEALSLTEYIWKISDTDYMLVSPNITLNIGDQEVEFSDYAQIAYVDNGIVRISHVLGTYQTISTESTLTTESGAELSLVGKNFIAPDGSTISLDDLALNDDSYIKLDENADDAPHIPTFNVINGKDGANGTDGKEGEKGDEGDEGDEGGEGDAGGDGGEGSAGGEGGEGYEGKDGVEGTTGSMGYDGAEGDAGKDADNAGNASDLAAASLNLKPTITMDTGSEGTGSEYHVNSGSAEMTLAMNDTDSSLLPGTTKVYLYDKETMELMNAATVDSLGSSLESNPNGASMKFSGLDPNKEYMLIVKADYEIMDGTPLNDVTLFTKTFKTDVLGVSIEKLEVTENSISAKTKVTDADMTSYSVVIYDYNADGTERDLAMYTVNQGANGCTGGQFKLIDKLSQVVMDEGGTYTGGKTNSYAGEAIVSNHEYFAKIANVTVSNQSMNSGDTEILLKTLKAKPYDRNKALQDPPVIEPVTSMQPILAPNEMNHALVLSLDDIEDPDYGIKGYRYELYLYDSSDAALISKISKNDFSMLTPAFTKESTTLTAQSFAIPDGDGNAYVGRVVALFNDNEKELELCTLPSNQQSLTSTSGRMLVEIVNTNVTETTNSATSARHDVLTGRIRITDPKGELINHISATNPLKLTVSNEYKDVEEFIYTEKPVQSPGENYYEYTFTISGLRAKTVHVLTVYGPYDSDGDSALSNVEKNTYLTASRASTIQAHPLTLVGADNPQATTAFAMGVILTSKDTTAIERSYAKYETEILDSVTLELIHVTETGETVIGTPKKLVNLNQGEAGKKDSTFNYAYLDRSDKITEIEKCKDENGNEIGGLKTSKANIAANNTYILTPTDFGLDNNDSVFYSGGYFKIRVKDAQDYTSFNPIPFKEGEDCYSFTIEKRHVQAINPNKQVTVTKLTNEAAASGFTEDVDDDTVVGLRFRPEYAYTDINKITYHIYEVGGTKTISELDGTGQDIGTLLYTNAGSEGSDYLTEVLRTTQDINESNKFTATSVELYFKGSASNTTGVVWTKPDGTTPAADEAILQRGKRYIVTYEVTEVDKHTSMECGRTRSSTYPNCAYEVGQNVPLYRSAIVELDKQVPAIERYPYSSTTDSVTWMYRFIDPDNAIVKNNDKAILTVTTYENLTKAQAGTFKAVTPYEFVLDGTTAPTYTSWQDDDLLTFTGLANNNYYKTTLQYKVSETAEVQTIESNIVLFKTKRTTMDSSQQAKIRVQGLQSGDGTQYVVTIGGKSYEAPLVNEGGYRYKLTLRGTNLTDYAAVQVKVAGVSATDGQTYTVTYDPVYLSGTNTVQETGATAEQYAYVYLDASPLQYLKDKNVAQADVSLKGYFSTQELGFGSYKEAFAYQTGAEYVDQKLDGENLFALRTTDGTTESFRRLNVGGAEKMLTTTYNGSVINSFFVPGTGAAADEFGLIKNISGQKTVATMKQRYPTMPLAVSDSTLKGESVAKGALGEPAKYNIEKMSMDATGLRDASGTYYTVEKLVLNSGTKSDITFKEDDSHQLNNTIVLSDLFPAVQKRELSIGGSSAVFDMNVIGTGASADSKIYARLLDADGNLLAIEQKTATEDGAEVKFYELNKEGTPNYSDRAAFGNSYIPLSAPGDGNIVANLRIRGLDVDTSYKVVFFTYDSLGNVMDLYSLDESRVGYAYPFTTLKAITINASVVDEVFNAYTDKHITVRFGIDGDEGTGFKIKYTVVGTGTTGWVDELGESYKYYSKDPMKNDSIILNLNPGYWRYNNSYQIKLEAISNVDHQPIGEKIITYNARTIKPTFYVTTAQQVIENGVRVSAEIKPKDPMKEIVANTYIVTLKDEQGNTVSVDTTSGVGNTNPIELNSLSGASVVAFDVPNASGTYHVVVDAYYDDDNDGVESGHKELCESSMIVIDPNASAQLVVGASLANKNVTIKLTNLQNFDSVTQVVITVFAEDGSQVLSATREKGDCTYIIDWDSIAAGEYTVQVQYRGSTNNMLGNGSVGMIVQ